MASAANTARLSVRLASRYAPRSAPRRGFRVSARERAAQNYTMPALSPTMTEGNISRWSIKEGDSYTAGDVILEIETDKATMDVEAQDDGMLFKITEPDGAKGVKVGARIAVMAEEGDDLGSLEMPADESGAGASASTSSEKSAPQSTNEGTPAEKPEEKAEMARPKDSVKERDMTGGATGAEGIKDSEPYSEATRTSGQATKKYPLFPSVQALLHENGLSDQDAGKITASGPAGRLLKGDVLAYLGKIAKDYPAQAAKRIDKFSHLDLSNITLAKPQPKAEALPKEAAKTPEAQLPKETEVAVPVSLTAVIATQKRVQDTLGIWLPLSTFIARASELANEQLPASKGKKPTADDLFNSVLGLDKVAGSKIARGHYFPDITGISPAPPPLARKAAKKPDIIDMLAPKAAKSKMVSPAAMQAALGVSAGDNIFSVTAKTGEEDRATEYLERLKMALEKEPGRLVL